MKILFTIILIISSFDINSKNHLSDSLNIEIERFSDQNDRYNRLMEIAREQIKENSEIALDCAYKAHEIATTTNNIKNEIESNILMGDIFCQTHAYPTAITYYEEAIKRMEHLGENKEIARLYATIANLYIDSNFDAKWSIEAMQNAERHASISNDKHLKTETDLSFGNIYLTQNMDSLANIYYDKVLDNQIGVKTIRNIAKALTGKAIIDMRKANYDIAISLIDSSSYLCIRDFYDNLLVKNYGYKAAIYDSIDKHDEARKYYLQGIKLAYMIEDYGSCGEYMLNLGLLNEKQGNHDAAIKIFEILRDSTEKFSMYDLCHKSYYNLSRCYASQGNYMDAYHMLRQYHIYYDSASIQKQEEKINELRTSYMLSLNIKELNRKELELEEIKHKRLDSIYIIITTISISILLILFTVLFTKNKILKREHKEIEYQQQLKINEMSKELMEMQLKGNRESLINLALHLKSFIEYITPLKDEIKDIIDLPEKEQNSRLKAIYQNMQNNFVIYKNMEVLQNQIDEIYKEFSNRLEQRYPTITKAEKRLCTMLYINMSSKEIAIITNTSLRSVETSRYRLRKKLNLDRDKDVIKFLKEI